MYSLESMQLALMGMPRLLSSYCSGVALSSDECRSNYFRQSGVSVVVGLVYAVSGLYPGITSKQYHLQLDSLVNSASTQMKLSKHHPADSTINSHIIWMGRFSWPAR